MSRIITAFLLLLPCTAAAQQALPFKFDPRATEAAITPPDLMTRVYLFADDSMMGRDAGTPGNLKATAYIAGELKRLGLTPAGDNGTYFQSVPLVRRSLSAQSQISLDGKPLTAWEDYAIYAQSGGERSFDGVQAVYAGTLGDPAIQLTPENVTGKLVIWAPGDWHCPRLRRRIHYFALPPSRLQGWTLSTPQSWSIFAARQ
jgi:hypothetical protein